MAEKETEEVEEKKSSLMKNKWKAATFVLAALLVVSILAGSLTGSVTASSLTEQQAADKAVDYINTNLVQQGEVEKTNVQEISGMFIVNTSYQGQTFPVYITNDGKFIFLSNPLDTAVEIQQPETTTEPTVTCEDLEKSGQPVIEAYVVSYCPYGTQMQRILGQMLTEAPELAENVKVRYIGSVVDGEVQAMHGEEEALENHRQICIREEQQDKFWPYISCFIQAGEVDACLEEAGVDITKLDACMSDSERGLSYAEEDFAFAEQYGVTGSPTLIVDGERVSEFDFGGRTPEALKTIICCSSSSPAEVCDTTLSEESAATGFTPEETGSGSGTC